MICPSNPYLSIDPILALNGVRSRIKQQRAAVIAVSPIVAGRAIKGPAAKILLELGRQPSALEIARHYAGLIDAIVIDEADAPLRKEIEALDMRVAITGTVMSNREDQARLAEVVVQMTAGS